MMMKFLVVTLALLPFVFSMPAERGKRDTGDTACENGDMLFMDGAIFNIPEINPCNIYLCSSGQRILLRGKCEDNKGICREEGSRWSEGCVFYRCARFDEGVYLPEIYHKSCYQGGRCRKLNSVWTSGCIVYQCIERNELRLKRISAQCEDDDGVCRSNGEKFTYNTHNSQNCSCTVSSKHVTEIYCQ